MDAVTIQSCKKELYQLIHIMDGETAESKLEKIKLLAGKIADQNISTEQLLQNLENIPAYALKILKFSLPGPICVSVEKFLAEVKKTTSYKIPQTVSEPSPPELRKQGNVSKGSLIGLSDEIILKILCLLGLQDVLNVKGSCKRLNILGDDCTLWENLCIKNGSLRKADIEGMSSYKHRKAEGEFWLALFSYTGFLKFHDLKEMRAVFIQQKWNVYPCIFEFLKKTKNNAFSQELPKMQECLNEGKDIRNLLIEALQQKKVCSQEDVEFVNKALEKYAFSEMDRVRQTAFFKMLLRETDVHFLDSKMLQKHPILNFMPLGKDAAKAALIHPSVVQGSYLTFRSCQDYYHIELAYKYSDDHIIFRDFEIDAKPHNITWAEEIEEVIDEEHLKPLCATSHSISHLLPKKGGVQDFMYLVTINVIENHSAYRKDIDSSEEATKSIKDQIDEILYGCPPGSFFVGPPFDVNMDFSISYIDDYCRIISHHIYIAKEGGICWEGLEFLDFQAFLNFFHPFCHMQLTEENGKSLVHRDAFIHVVKTNPYFHAQTTRDLKGEIMYDKQVFAPEVVQFIQNHPLIEEFFFLMHGPSLSIYRIFLVIIVRSPPQSQHTENILYITINKSRSCNIETQGKNGLRADAYSCFIDNEGKWMVPDTIGLGGEKSSDRLEEVIYTIKNEGIKYKKMLIPNMLRFHP